MKRFKLKEMIEISLLVALAIVLDKLCSFIKFTISGGSINIAAIPLFIIALRHNFLKTFIASGVVFGFISFITDGYMFGLFFLEYFLAFGNVAILSFFAKYIFKNFNNKKIKCYLLVTSSILLWAILRFFLASIDSVIFYDYTFVAAFIYNVGYVFLSALFDIVIMLLLLKVLDKINHKYVTEYLSK